MIESHMTIINADSYSARILYPKRITLGNAAERAESLASEWNMKVTLPRM